MNNGSRDSKAQDLPRGLIDRRGTPAAKAARLPSLRGPRDLTLGGVPKKIYAPTIPVRKEKPREGASDQHDTKEGQNPFKEHSGCSRGRGGGRGRGRGRGQGNLIQTPSLFEMGPAVEPGYKSGSSSYDGRVGGGLSGGRGGAPTRVKQENARRGGELQNQTLDHLLRDDFIADGPEDDPDMIPVVLPMSSVAMGELKREQRDISGDATIHIKQEPMDCENEGSKCQPTRTPSSFTMEETTHHKKEDRMTINHLLNSVAKSEKEELIFLQLPDVLPGIPKEGLQLGFSDGGTGTANKENKENDELQKKMGAFSLDHFSEGYIGKLQVRKSGKAELVLGDIVLDVTMGTSCGFLQDVVSVRTGENDKHMTVLGHLSHRLICSPNFEHLFNI